ncbi:MAG: MBL fold metallo-hydrolase [Chlamydiia bacterium]|nr:MBL fold metallo-hydrolase [Chlamydiia bacterium]
MLGFCPLASGSKGNALYIGTPQTKILIDAGLSGRQVILKLAEINVDISEIDAIVVTHEHSDHIQGLKTLAFRYGIPVFANAETAKGIVQAIGECPKFKIFTTGESFEYGDLELHPFSIQHDTLDPVAFTVSTGGEKLGICADLGFVTNLVRHRLQECDMLYVEANHQPSMVHACPRPMVYKQRVLSRHGHLSNPDCGALIADVWHPGLKQVYLAHLSSECNSPETALSVVTQTLSERGLHVDLNIAYQERVSRPYAFGHSHQPAPLSALY